MNKNLWFGISKIEIMDFDKNKYKIYDWKNWINIHWMINPGLAINELILGQKVPKVYLEDKTSDKPRIERSFVPCPHCDKMHDGRTWSTQNNTGFKNWFGLYCNNCGEIIPCLMNVGTLIILTLTFPLWGWFRKSLKASWLKKQPQRFEDIDLKEIKNPFEGNGWIRIGLTFGFLMFIICGIIIPLFQKRPMDIELILISIAIYILGGLAFGYIMKLFMNKKGIPN